MLELILPAKARLGRMRVNGRDSITDRPFPFKLLVLGLFGFSHSRVPLSGKATPLRTTCFGHSALRISKLTAVFSRQFELANSRPTR